MRFARQVIAGIVIWCALADCRAPSAAGEAPPAQYKGKTLREWLLLRSKETGNEAEATLDAYCKETPEASAVLVPLLSDNQAILRRMAVRYLPECWPDDDKAMPSLIRMTGKDPDAGVRAEACDSLPRMVREDEGVAAALLGALAADRSPGVRVAAARGVKSVCPKGDKNVVGALVAALKDPAESVRAEASQSLARVGYPAQFLPHLDAMLKDVDEEAALGIVEQSADVGEGALPALRQSVSSKCQTVASRAAYRLALMRKKKEHRIEAVCDAVPAIAALLTSPDVEVRRLAGRSLVLIGEDSVDAVKELSRAVSDKDAKVRSTCIYALRRIGSEAYSAAEPIARALSDENSAVRREAAEALGEIRGSNKVVVPALIAALKDEEMGVRTFAVESLGRIGTDAKMALPAVRVLLRDPERQVREFAARAIRQIEGKE